MGGFGMGGFGVGYISMRLARAVFASVIASPAKCWMSCKFMNRLRSEAMAQLRGE